MALITVTVGEEENEKDIRFDVSVVDYNKYLDDTTPNDRVGPSWNFLIKTVHQEDKATFKEIAMLDGKPNGMVVMMFIGEVVGEMAGSVSIKLKKPNRSPSK